MKKITPSVRDAARIIPASCLRLEILVDVADDDSLLCVIQRHCAHRSRRSVRVPVPAGVAAVLVLGLWPIDARCLVLILQGPLLHVQQQVFDGLRTPTHAANGHILVIVVSPPTLFVFSFPRQGEGTTIMDELVCPVVRFIAWWDIAGPFPVVENAIATRCVIIVVRVIVRVVVGNSRFCLCSQISTDSRHTLLGRPSNNLPVELVIAVNGHRRSKVAIEIGRDIRVCLLYTSPSPRDGLLSRMPSSA